MFCKLGKNTSSKMMQRKTPVNCVKIISELLLIDAENERAKKCLSFDDLFEKPTMF